MPDISEALSEDRNGTIIALEITAGAKTDVFPYGYNEWRKMIGCRVMAPAVDGKANKAIVNLISKTLSVPASSISILSGSISSQKRVLVAGISKKALLANLNPLL
jgi:hypothetical protein